MEIYTIRDKNSKAQKTVEKIGNEKGCGIDIYLPDDVLMTILNRIHDLKCLFRCTLVSKGLAENIYHVKSISLKLPAFDMNSNEAFTNIFHLPSLELLVELDKISNVWPPPPPSSKLKFTTFLEKFTELERAYFEFACPETPCSLPSLKWKANLGNSGPAIEMLLASVLTKTLVEVAESESEEEEDDGEEENEDEENEEDEDEENEEDEDEEHEEVVTTDEYPEKNLAKGCLLSSLMSFAECVDLMFSLVKNHDALKEVICTDSGKHGKIVLDAEQIVEWRKRLMCGELTHNAIPRKIFVSDVCASLPGFPKKRYFLVIMHFISQQDLGTLDAVKSLEYDQEEEAVTDTLEMTTQSLGWYILRE